MAHRWDPRAPGPGPLVRPVPIDPAGAAGPTRRQAAGRYWRRTTPRLYVPADITDEQVEQRILEQSMTLPRDGAVTGWAACRLHGANFCDGLARDGKSRLPVPLNVGPRGFLPRNAGARPVFRQLAGDDRAIRFGIPTVTAVRATYDAVLLADDETEAVVAIDMMCAAELVSLRMLHAYADRQRFRRRKFDEALARASEHSRSPNETRLRRLAETGAELPELKVNCDVLDLSGRLLGIADLLDVEAGLVIEFNGADHRSALRQTADVRKEERLRRVGLEVTGVTGMDLREPGRVVRRLVDARSRARFESSATRRWAARPRADDLHQRLEVARVLREQHTTLADEPVPEIRDIRGW
jgi:very-short-patch-repair endonuclease